MSILPNLHRTPGSALPFWGLLFTLIGLFLFGGSSRPDVQSLAILNPIMVICCAAALLTLGNEQLRNMKLVAYIVGIAIFVAAFYFTPLPEPLEASSSGLSAAADILDTANISGGPHILAIVPDAALHSFFFLFGPLAILLFAAQLDRQRLQLTVPLFIGIGTVSGIFGMLQLAGGADGSLYLYRITNNGSAVGLFANRNHAAVFLACIFPLLGILSAKGRTVIGGHRRMIQLIAITISILLVPLILVTGSRSGMLAAFIGLIGGALLYTSDKRNHRGSEARMSLAPIFVTTGLICIILVTIYFSRAEAISRIFTEQNSAYDRTDFWVSSIQMFWQYFPFGFGPGGFAPAFQINEPLELLAEEYLNRLHNDWLEAALTYGVTGIMLMFAGAVYYLRRTFVLWMHMEGDRTAVALGRMASIVIAILAVASLSDYPLRTPAMAGFAALALVWFNHARRELV